jgi:hypothetical protein
VFERLAVDVLKSVVSVFESFARQQFSAGCWARPGRDEVDLYELRHACATPLLTTRA